MVTGSIVLYKNDPDVLEKAISSFLFSELSISLYLIDNSPSDDLRYICHDKRITYIYNRQNIGFGAGHNIAIKKVIEKGAKYHLVLNPDVFYDSRTLEKLVRFLDENPNIGNVMPKVLYPNGNLQYLCKLLPTPYDWIGRRFNPFKEIVEKRNRLFELHFANYDKIMEIPFLSGCFMLLRVSALKEVGGFDENFFMYCEDTDLCRRLMKGGFKTVFYPYEQIYHEFAKGSHRSWRLTLVGIKSAIYYFNKWGWFFDKERRAINRETLMKIRNNE